tara:strand:+ start:936 stop:2108 length:1173 start_codon:yes stop_codon:yes gene_type:complete
MKPPFDQSEYQRRLDTVRAGMLERNLDAIVIGDPANMNWLTGFDAWSFYVPQVMVVQHNQPPVWLGRQMDSGAIPLTTYLGAESIRPYAEDLIQRNGTHPMEAIGVSLIEMGLGNKRIGYESDTYYFSSKAVDCLKTVISDASWIDADLLVNWCRAVKSDAEIEVMRQAARIASHVMAVACEHIAPGVRQCDLVSKILAAQVSGVDGMGGDLTSICPLILAGEAAATAHPLWTDEPFTANQTVALELGGARKRYNAGLARTLQLGQGRQKVYDTAGAVKEGLEAVLDCIRPGISADEVHRAWQGILDRYGLVKESRIGYSIGVGYAPDWGEHTVSLRANEDTVLEPNMTLHVMLGMWMDGWGIELSETVAVTKTGVECLTQFGRELILVR